MCMLSLWVPSAARGGERVNGSASSLHPARGQFPATPSSFPPPALPTTSRLCHAEINYFMSPNMQIILLNERCLTSQIQLICKCKWGFICDILYGWQKTKRLLNSNTNCSDWLSHIIIQSEYSKYQNSDWNEPEQHIHTHMHAFMHLLVCFLHQIWRLRFILSKGTNHN